MTVTTKEGGDVSFLVNYDWKNNDCKWHFLRIIYQYKMHPAKLKYEYINYMKNFTYYDIKHICSVLVESVRVVGDFLHVHE